MDELIGDVQTSVLGLAGGFFGELSERVGNYAANAVGASGSSNPIEGAVDFIARATASAASMLLFAQVMPQTSRNQFAQIMFWWRDRRTIESGSRLVTFVIRAAGL